MEPNDLNKVIKGTTTEADDEFMTQIADALRTRKPMSPAERERYDSINKAREEELELQDAAFKLEKQGKLNMDMKEHFKARMNNQLNEINVFGAMRTASSKKESPLFAGMKAIGTNIQKRGLLAGLGARGALKQYIQQAILNLSPRQYPLGGDFGSALQTTRGPGGETEGVRGDGKRYTARARPPASGQQTTASEWKDRGVDAEDYAARLQKILDKNFPEPEVPIEKPSLLKIARGQVTSLGRGKGKR